MKYELRVTRSVQRIAVYMVTSVLPHPRVPKGRKNVGNRKFACTGFLEELDTYWKL